MRKENYTKDGRRFEDFHFDSFQDFVAHADNSPSMRNKDFGSVRRGTIRDNIHQYFSGASSWDEIMRLARAGWKDGMELAKSISDRLEHMVTGQIERTDIHYDVTGEVLDVGRFCAGEPEHWGQWHTTIVEGQGNRFVHVVLGGNCSGDIDKDVLIVRGATLAALVNLMELAGYRVKVTYTISNGRKHVAQVFAPVKDYDEALDQDKLTYALAHPSVLRGLGFCTWDTVQDSQVFKSVNRDAGYGMVRDIPKEQQGDIYIEAMTWGDSRWRDEKTAVAWLIKTLREYHVLKAD